MRIIKNCHLDYKMLQTHLKQKNTKPSLSKILIILNKNTPLIYLDEDKTN